jgi:hypothetical protein
MPLTKIFNSKRGQCYLIECSMSKCDSVLLTLKIVSGFSSILSLNLKLVLLDSYMFYTGNILLILEIRMGLA